MESPKIIIHVELSVLPEHAAEIKAAAQGSRIVTIKEAGCEYFMQTVSKDDPNTLIFFEVFTSKESHEFHLQTPYAKEFFAAVEGKLAKAPVVMYLDEL